MRIRLDIDTEKANDIKQALNILEGLESEEGLTDNLDEGIEDLEEDADEIQEVAPRPRPIEQRPRPIQQTKQGRPPIQPVQQIPKKPIKQKAKAELDEEIEDIADDIDNVADDLL